MNFMERKMRLRVGLAVFANSIHSRILKFIFVALLTISGTCISLPMQGQTSDLADLNKRLHLLLPGDPDYSDKIRLFPSQLCCQDSTAAPGVIAINGTSVSVKALSIAWSTIGPTGEHAVFYTVLFPEPEQPYLFPGGKDLLVSGGSSLITPAAHIERLPSGLISAPRSTMFQPALEDALLHAKSVHVRIDAAIFANGIIIGADKGGLSIRFLTEQNGAIAEARTLLNESSDETLKDAIGWDARRPTSDSADPVLAARTREAIRLQILSTFKSSSALHSAVLTLASYQAMPLRRLRSPLTSFSLSDRER
jgi:hypothetical protein